MTETVRRANPPVSITSRHPLAPRHPHAHDRGHLSPGRRLRCGCDTELVARERAVLGDDRAGAAPWHPVQRQHVGWRRAHQVYSDRMACPSR